MLYIHTKLINQQIFNQPNNLSHGLPAIPQMPFWWITLYCNWFYRRTCRCHAQLLHTCFTVTLAFRKHNDTEVCTKTYNLAPSEYEDRLSKCDDANDKDKTVVRRSWDRLIFIMGIPIMARRQLYIETAPGLHLFICLLIAEWRSLKPTGFIFVVVFTLGIISSPFLQLCVNDESRMFVYICKWFFFFANRHQLTCNIWSYNLNFKLMVSYVFTNPDYVLLCLLVF